MIGIVPSFNPASGGEFQYSVSVLRSLDRLAATPDNFIVFVRPQDRPHLTLLGLSQRFSLEPLRPGSAAWTLDSVKALARNLPFAAQLQDMCRIVSNRGQSRGAPRTRESCAAHFHSHDIRWILYTAPHVISFEAGVPFVMPIHDVQHRLQRHFPEVSASREFERREYMFGNAAKRAHLILVDSESGKEDVLACYGNVGLTEDRVAVLPFLPPDYLRHAVSAAERVEIRSRYRLPTRYLFYPAQFWPHKNHRRLIEAIGHIARRHPDLHLVLVGAATGNLREATLREALEAARQHGINSRIHRLGYVPNADMAALYAEAEALVFPTFFGPTNIPVLEAWALGTPVITSRIRGITEHVGDAGLLLDPNDKENMAATIERLWTDTDLRQLLAERGRQRLMLYDTPQFDERLTNILARMERI